MLLKCYMEEMFYMLFNEGKIGDIKLKNRFV